MAGPRENAQLGVTVPNPPLPPPELLAVGREFVYAHIVDAACVPHFKRTFPDARFADIFFMIRDALDGVDLWIDYPTDFVVPRRIRVPATRHRPAFEPGPELMP